MIRATLIAAVLATAPLADTAHADPVDFSFEGPFGRYDPAQLRRGLQVYSEVCAACHGLQYVPIRTLSDPGGPGLTADQLRALTDLLDPVVLPDGTERPRRATDAFPTRNGLGMGPDLSLMAKARTGFDGPYGTGLNQLIHGQGGPEYIDAFLTHFTDDTQDQADTAYYGNTVFPGGWTAMPPPLFDDMIIYEDGTPASVQQMSRDVAAFLMWTAEPRLEARKRTGIVAVGLLTVLSALLFALHRRLWAPLGR
ncbi:MAG TPA: cytochrome c1 [Paenirhodobacter sp.]